MDFTVVTPDPFGILASTKAVMESARFVRLNKKAVEQTAVDIREYLKEHSDFPDRGHRLTGDFKTDAQLIFFESMMGFCFWVLPGKPKWGIELQDGEKVDGWYGVCAAFRRAYEEGVPVTDADFLARASESEVRNIFRSATGAEIPLLDKRVAILNENARILKEGFGGEAVFLKIAHLLALDVEYRLTPESQRPFLKNFDQLSVFADYKLPQLLRMFGVVEYEKSLAETVDSYTVISPGSPQEIEIRSAAIWGIELLRQEIQSYSSIQIGHVIWLKSQDQSLQSRIKPYHRTYTTFY